MNVSTRSRALGLGLLLAAGCQRPEEVPPPPHLLPKDQMVYLLTQIHLLEARLENSRLAPDSARSLFLSQQKNLFWQQHVPPDDSTFERSYRYYMLHGKDLDEIYQAVTDSLTAEQRRLGGNTWQPEQH